MKYFEDQSTNNTILVLKKGEELAESLSKYAVERNLKGAWINVIGGASNVTLGFYNSTNRDYTWLNFEEQLEIVGLQGNLAYVEGEPFWHIHGVFSREDGSTIAGHVKSCIIGLTGEVYLTPHNTLLTRRYDEETGLKLIEPLE